MIITSPFLDNGGVAQFIKNLSPFFAKSDLIFRRGKRKKEQTFSFLLPFLDILRFLFFIARNKSNRVVVNTSLSNVGLFRDGAFVLISKVFRKEVVLYIHGFEFSALSNKFLLKNGYFKSDIIFVLANEFKVELLKLGYRKQIIVSNNPVSHDLILKAEKSRRKFKEQKTIKVLMISRVVASKGVFIGVDIAKQMQDHNIEFHIAGTGEGLDEIKGIVKRSNISNVFFHGYISGFKKEALLNKSDILLFPTYHNEGLPINILESLVMGLYVITRPVAGIKDIANRYEISLVKSIEPDDYVEIIKSILNVGIDIDTIVDNQNKAFLDFSPREILSTLKMKF